MIMKQCKFILIVILLGLIFSSCDEDSHSYWTTGTLEKRETYYTDREGLITRSFEIDERDIYPDGRFRSIEDINFDGDESIILTVGNRAIIDKLWLSVDGTNVKVFFENLTRSKEFYDGDVARFMSVVVDQMRRNGYVRINVDAENIDWERNIQLDIELFAELKVYVRD